MFERLIDYFLIEPRRLMVLGQGAVRSACFLLVLGAVAHAATESISAAKAIGGHGLRVDQPPSLADLLPALPTWWVPESALGFGLVVLFFAAGLVMVHAGRTYERFLRH